MKDITTPPVQTTKTKTDIKIPGSIIIASLMVFFFSFLVSISASYDIIMSFLGYEPNSLIIKFLSYDITDYMEKHIIVYLGVAAPIFLLSVSYYLYNVIQKQYNINFKKIISILFLNFIILFSIYGFVFLKSDKKEVFMGNTFYNSIESVYFLGGNLLIMLIIGCSIEIFIMTFYDMFEKRKKEVIV